MKEREKTLEKKLKDKVHNLGGWCIKISAAWIVGLPDRLCLMPGGVLFFAEVKSTGKKPTHIQTRIHDRIRGLGFRVEIIDNSQKIEEVLK